MDTSRLLQSKRKGKKTLIKRTTTTASATSIRIANIEAFSIETIIEMHLTIFQILEACGIHQKGDPITLQQEIVLFLIVEGHAILKTRATTRLDKNTERLPRLSLLGFKPTNLRNCTVA